MTKIPVLDKGFVRLVGHHGDDLLVVNAARVSFSKESEWEEGDDCRVIRTMPDGRQVVTKNRLSDKDARLIRYLAKHEHWTPFGHPQITLHFKWPIFVARQAMRSNIGICWNEVSRRYVDDTPEFYEPEVWRGRPEGSIKQGSGTQEVRLKPPVGTDFDGKSFEYEDLWGDCDNGWAIPLHNSKHHYDAVEWYKWLLESGVAPEMARMVLPQSAYTEAWGTFSLAALARFYKLRADSHAQLEIQEFAHAIDSLVCPMFPVSWAALTNKE